MADVDVVDPELEVRKLQDLVRKLELQNDILRAKQNKHNSKTISISSDDLEIIDLESINDESLGNDETWLYVSPKALTPDQKKKSPYQWAREPFDENTSPELESVRRSLLFKLDEVSIKGRLSRSTSGNALPLVTSPDNNVQSSFSLNTRHNNNINVSYGGVPSIKRPLASHLNNRVVDTNTFTRPKKNQISPVQRNDWDGPITITDYADSATSLDQNDNKQELRTQQPTVSERKVLDVHILAKMQEESLRQSFSPLNSRRRSSRGKNGGFFLSQQLSNESDTIVSPSSHDSNRSSPCHLDGELAPPPRRLTNATSQASVSTASLNSNGSSQGSTGSTPPDSLHDGPYHTDHGLHQRLHQVQGRNSVPNVRGYVNGLRPNQSDSDLVSRDSTPRTRNGRFSPQSRASVEKTSPGSSLRQPSPSNISRLQQPSPVQRAVSPPSRSGIPIPGHSSIPRPGAAPKTSNIPAPRRSSLPASMMRPTLRTPSTTPTHDESWKEGCF